MIDHEIDRITSAINRLRPDWPIKQLDTLIRERLADRPRRDVAVALTWVACETSTTTPYRVLETGPWWIAVAVDGQTTGRRTPFDPNLDCDVCGKRNHPDDAITGHAFESRHDADSRRANQPRRKETPDAI